MNRKQKTVLWVAILIIAPIFVGRLIGGLQVAVQFGTWDILFDRIVEQTVRTLPLTFLMALVAGGLIYAFRDKKDHKPKDD